VCLLCTLLVSCSNGVAREARRDEARDAGLTQQLAAEQATRIVERYFPSTATPSPTQPPIPALGDLAITFGFRPDGTPDGSYDSVPAGVGTAYAAALLTGVAAGQVIQAVVIDAWGNELASPEVAISPGPAEQWVALPIPLPPDLAPGEYGVFVFADDQPLGSLAFGVTGIGTSAQLLPEQPANPQARSTVPPPGSQAQEAPPTEAVPTLAPAT
jgi:hypothetical protein